MRDSKSMLPHKLLHKISNEITSKNWCRYANSDTANDGNTNSMLVVLYVLVQFVGRGGVEAGYVVALSLCHKMRQAGMSCNSWTCVLLLQAILLLLWG